MAVNMTLVANQGSSVGPWAETGNAGLTNPVTCAATTTTAISLAAATAGYQFNTNLPVVCCALTPGTLTSSAGTAYNTIQGGANTGLPAGTGIISVTYSSPNVTVTFNNNTASATTVTAGTRLIFLQPSGN